MSGFRLSQDAERALIRAHLNGLGSLTQDESENVFSFHKDARRGPGLSLSARLLAQSLIDKKQAQVQGLRVLAGVFECCAWRTAYRDRSIAWRWSEYRRKWSKPDEPDFRCADLLRHWARKFEREARGE